MLIPAADALSRVRLAARDDGLFVFELEIDDAKGFDPGDIDELAHAVSTALKQDVLNHTPYHQVMAGDGLARRLRPTQILVVYPVRLAPGPWNECLADGALNADHVRAALALNPMSGKPAHHALAVLRDRYLQLEDTIGFRIAVHRRRQEAADNLTRLLAALFYALLATGLILLPLARLVRGVDPWAIPGLVLTVVGLAVALHFRQRIAVWDSPVVYLLRAAHGFFVSSNSINKVVEGADLDRQGRPVDDFDTIARNLQSRLEGEQQRVSLGQGWLALAVAGASLMAALAAFQTLPT